MPKDNPNSHEDDKSKKTKDLVEAKIALQKAFDSKRNALGVLLTGLIAGLFAWVQIIQTPLKALSSIFLDLTEFNINYIFLGETWITVIKLSFFVGTIFALLFFIIRTVFRFALYSRYSDNIYWVEEKYLIFPKELKRLKKKDSLIQAREATGLMIAGKIKKDGKKQREKFLGIVYHDWFISGTSWGHERNGYFLNAFLAVVSTIILMFLLN